MRPMIIGGIVLICLGVFVLIRGASFSSQRDVVKIGDVKITADERKAVPPWAGGLAIVVGAAMVLAGTRQRRSA